MIRKLYEKYEDKILYLVFGALATAVNTGVFWLCAHPLGMDALPSTMIAWLVAVIFAYITNRNWVFHSEASTRSEFIREFVSFILFSCTREHTAMSFLRMETRRKSLLQSP